MTPPALRWKCAFEASRREWGLGVGWMSYGRDEYVEAYLAVGPFWLRVWREVAV
jgi:hypothetical protein